MTGTMRISNMTISRPAEYLQVLCGQHKLKEMQTTPEIFNQSAGSNGKWDLLFASAFPN